MSVTIDDRKAALDGAQRIWLKRMADAMGLRVADAGLLAQVAPATAQFKGQPPGGTTVAPVAQQKKPVPQPIVYTRTKQIDTTGQSKRKDNLPITGAKTEEDVTKIVEEPKGNKGLTAAKLDEMHQILREADSPMNGNTGVPTMVPSAEETKKIRAKYAKLNDGLSNGNLEEAARMSRELGLPISDEMLLSDQSKVTDTQWKTLLALGVAKFSASKKLVNGAPKFKWDSNPSILKVPNQELNALNGTAGYAQLIDDMAAQGVTPLSAPPEQAQMHKYLENVQAKAKRQAEIDHPGDPSAQQRAVSDALLKSSQRLMDGMQVHYRGAGNTDVKYGPTEKATTFLFRKGKLVTGDDGKPLQLELKLPSNFDPKRSTPEIKKWVSDNGGGYPFTTQTKTPEGWGDVGDQKVFGNRHESDCEGMASFRLRTLPPTFKPLGVVSGRLRKGGIGHLVAIFQSPEGRVFISSNGKPLIEVNPVSADGIHWAVVAEFDAIYGGNQTEKDFFFGLAKATSVTGSDALDTANKSADRMLKEASADDMLQSKSETRDKMPRLDWSRLAP